jgi:putative DNA primase/helicase
VICSRHLVAQMYLDMSGEWCLPPLAGVSSAPLLSADGSVRAAEGYDPVTALWCCSIPSLRLPLRPSFTDAEAALGLLRHTFCTFPFGDAPRRWDASLEVEVIDNTEPPGRDESAFLVAVLTAVCRPSLWLAPGMLVTAPAVLGAGSGKGAPAWSDSHGAAEQHRVRGRHWQRPDRHRGPRSPVHFVRA